MKKQGYTLAEILIAIGIVGVISALMLPIFNKIQPDQNKALYLKAYRAITAASSELAADKDIYPITNITNANDKYDYSQYPFYNTSAVQNAARGINFTGGQGKFAEALAWAFNGKIPDNYDHGQTFEENGFQTTFKIPNGMEFMVETAISDINNNGGEGQYSSTIWVDVDGSDKGKNCSITSCTNPDRFKFVVAANGVAVPADAKGKEYVANQHNLKKNANKTKLPAGENQVDSVEVALASIKKVKNTGTGLKDTLSEYTKADDAPDIEVTKKVGAETVPVTPSSKTPVNIPFLTCEMLGNCFNAVQEETDECAGLSDQECSCKKQGLTGVEYDCCVNPDAEGCQAGGKEEEMDWNLICARAFPWRSDYSPEIGFDGKNLAVPNDFDSSIYTKEFMHAYDNKIYSKRIVRKAYR